MGRRKGDTETTPPRPTAILTAVPSGRAAAYPLWAIPTATSASNPSSKYSSAVRPYDGGNRLPSSSPIRSRGFQTTNDENLVTSMSIVASAEAASGLLRSKSPAYSLLPPSHATVSSLPSSHALAAPSKVASHSQEPPRSAPLHTTMWPQTAATKAMVSPARRVNPSERVDPGCDSRSLSYWIRFSLHGCSKGISKGSRNRSACYSSGSKLLPISNAEPTYSPRLQYPTPRRPGRRSGP